MSQLENKKKLKFIAVLSLLLCVAWLFKNGFLDIFKSPATSLVPAAVTPVENVATEKSPPAVENKAPEKIKEPVADLVEFRLDVSFRRSGELIWKPVSETFPLFQYDAIQTHKDARAKVIFKTGSELEISQNTLIIIDPHSATNAAKTIDRAVMRSGKVQGKTKGQLWILTSAAVIKINQGKNKKEAVATVQMKEGEKIKIELKQGEGSLILPLKNNDAAEQVKEITLEKNKMITVDSPPLSDTAKEKLGEDESATNWYETAKVIKEAFVATKSKDPASAKKNETPDEAIKAPDKFFIIDQPAARVETTLSEISIQGRTNIKNSQILLNGQSYPVPENGEFTILVSLKLGLNIFVLQLTSSDGKSLFQRIIVKRVVGS